MTRTDNARTEARDFDGLGGDAIENLAQKRERDCGAADWSSRQTTVLHSQGLMKWELRWLLLGTILWLAYQTAYLGWDLKTAPPGGMARADHLPNFLIVAGASSAMFGHRWRRYWRQILFGAMCGLVAWTLALSMFRDTPWPLLTTAILAVLIPGALAPWRWYWTAACSLLGLAALLALQMIDPGSNPGAASWEDYRLFFILAVALSYTAAMVRELRHTQRNLVRLRLAERRLRAARSELRGRVRSLQANEKRLREEIEERQRAQERADEQESFLRAFFEASPDMMGIASMPEGKIIDLNPRYQKLLGMSREEARGKRITDMGIVAVKEQFEIYADTLARDGAITNFEMDLRSSDGAVHPFLVSAVLTVVNGQRCAVAIGRDMSGVREAEELVRAIAQSVPDPVTLTSYPEGRIIYCNRGYELMMGLPREAIIGHLPEEIGVWVRKEDEGGYARLIRTHGSVSNLEVELRSAGGTIGSWLMSGTKIEIRDREYILTTCRDISAIKRTEHELMAAREELNAQVEALRAGEERLRQEARGREEVEKRLRQSEAMFRKVFDTSIDIIGINSIVDGRFVAVNRSHLEFTGQRQEDVLGRSALDLDMWEDHERAREYLRLLRRDRSVHGFEANLRRWDGTLVPHITSAIVVDIEDEPCVVAIAHDISARKRAEMVVLAAREELSRQLEATRESEQRARQSETILRKIFDASPNSTMLIRLADGKHLVINQAAARMYGYSLEEFQQRSNVEMNLWIKVEERDEYLRRLRIEGRVRDMEAQVRAKHGPDLTMLLSAELVDVSGEKCVVAIASDITAAKRIEAELVAAREEAVAASEAKSNFLSSMSHEIRTPMNAMLGMADLLWETPLTAEQRRFLDTIRGNSNALLDLINGILDLAKVESGRLSLEWITFDPRELAERVVETLGVKAHQKWLELGARIAPGVPAELLGDPLRLRQILMNLIGNAIKFTEHGEVVLEIEPCADEPLHSSWASGAHGAGNGNSREQKLRFMVRDTGIGIRPERIDQIFATFTQAESSTERKYGGSGLGLAIVKRLVELMGGTLSVTSRPEDGSIFSLVIPFQLPPSANAGLNPAAPWIRPGLTDRSKLQAKAILARLGGRRVLVADDTAINRTILREVLEPSGARVDEAENGQAALRMVTAALEIGDPYGLVLVDGRMPGLDGVETARRLLRDDEMSFRCGAVILMVTSDALNPTLARCRELGLQRMRAFRYVVKPVRMAELAEAIEQVLFMGEAAAPGPNPADGSLPMIPPQGFANGTKHKGKVAVPVTNGNTKALKVLLAEDSPDNRTLIEAYFKGTNYQLEMVENGELAVERFTRGAFDAVLMDIHMPVMDGYTATRKIREWECANGRERTPVMALTAAAQDEAVRESLAAGCDSHLAKPIRRSILLQAIEEITSRKNSAKDLGAANGAVTGKGGEGKLGRNVVQIDADLSDLVPGFMAHKREDTRTIAAAIELGDYETLSQVGHKMKGEGGSYGFDAITTMGAALEEAAKVKDRAAVRHWAHELVTFLDTVEIVYA